MAQTTGRARLVGDYWVGRQIGSGSFSVVWHARHRVHGTEVAIKEIVMARLNKKLQDSLISEIDILKRINHPHIIRLHDIIQIPGKLHLVLEYCKGGDLSMYIQRHGCVPEETAKHFMKQLAAGLQVLRDNNLIHRDLKPQNLLLSTDDSNAVLKIADFGFARSLQPRGLAETLCGSPLYMAPEIMQLQKYDAKADLWSVGAILFQLVTGKTPFTGSNQIQLLQNIVKSTELHFPPGAKDLSSDCKDLCHKLLRRNPVERLTFEEFFNHSFLSQRQPDSLLRSRSSSRSTDGSPILESNSVRNIEESSQVTDSLELIDQDYVIVSGPPIEVSTCSASISKPSHIPYKSNSPPGTSIASNTTSTAPIPIIGSTNSNTCCIGSLESQSSAPGTSLGSMDIGYAFEQPSTHGLTRIKSLQNYASSITELARGKIEAGRHLEAFSVQLVILAIWKQALHICHTQAASAMDASPSQESIRLRSSCKKHGTPNTEECRDVNTLGLEDMSSQIQREFLREVEHAEELAKVIEPGSTEMPDAMETIFQAALALGKHGGVRDLMGDMESAALLYSKAVQLLSFLLKEAPSLILNPPFSLTNSDRYRLQNYIDILNNRQGHSRSQRMALLKCQDQA
ncbi:serine/threonine-protein kinase ATG1c-like isoform X3 [Mangifera indica]|uniref:serine/threonine-protein kinase ATG1c-like isoform X3 n=1 Tax=Mangifera indica TaxID=29780 RepID=UPI001CFA0786|nr:serine/threonine-protein kinase ATG1c-like isoform X3 [Mangifera indica]